MFHSHLSYYFVKNLNKESLCLLVNFSILLNVSKNEFLSFLLFLFGITKSHMRCQIITELLVS